MNVHYEWTWNISVCICTCTIRHGYFYKKDFNTILFTLIKVSRQLLWFAPLHECLSWVKPQKGEIWVPSPAFFPPADMLTQRKGLMRLWEIMPPADLNILNRRSCYLIETAFEKAFNLLITLEKTSAIKKVSRNNSYCKSETNAKQPCEQKIPRLYEIRNWICARLYLAGTTPFKQTKE